MKHREPRETSAAPDGVSCREAAGAFAVLALAALVFTWPLARHLGGAVPAGGGPPTVALFGLRQDVLKALETRGIQIDNGSFGHQLQ